MNDDKIYLQQIERELSPKTEKLPLWKKIRYFLEYIPLRFLMILFKNLPYAASLKTGRLLGRLVGLFLRSRTQIAYKNISESFPEIHPEKTTKIIKKCWENLGQIAAEFSTIPDIKKENFFSMVEIEGKELVENAYKAGRGVMLLTGHLGAWELSAQYLPFSGYRAALVARRIKNPYVNELINGTRSSHGNKIILAKNAVRESIKWLKQGNILVMLIDHRITEGGLQVPLFKKPAYTTSLPAILALRYSIPTFMSRGLRIDNKIKITFSPVNFTDLAHEKDEIYKATVRLNSMLEIWIKENPEQWLWIHNRWKK